MIFFKKNVFKLYCNPVQKMSMRAKQNPKLDLLPQEFNGFFTDENQNDLSNLKTTIANLKQNVETTNKLFTKKLENLTKNVTRNQKSLILILSHYLYEKIAPEKKDRIDFQDIQKFYSWIIKNDLDLNFFLDNDVSEPEKMLIYNILNDTKNFSLIDGLQDPYERNKFKNAIFLTNKNIMDFWLRKICFFSDMYADLQQLHIEKTWFSTVIEFFEKKKIKSLYDLWNTGETTKNLIINLTNHFTENVNQKMYVDSEQEFLLENCHKKMKRQIELLFDHEKQKTEINDIYYAIEKIEATHGNYEITTVSTFNKDELSGFLPRKISS